MEWFVNKVYLKKNTAINEKVMINVSHKPVSYDSQKLIYHIFDIYISPFS